MDELEDWLKASGDFEQGVMIYNDYAPRYRPNRALAFQINLGNNSLSRELLREELQLIFAELEKRRPRTKESAKYHTRGEQIDLPEDLRKLDNAIPEYYKKRDFNRYKAREMQPGPSLRDVAYQAVRYDLMIRQAYKVLDYYKRTGLYPPDYAPPGTAAEQGKIEQLTFWLRAMKSYPSFISRNKNNPNRKKDVEVKQKVLEEINQYLAYVDQQE